jgi:hypothetical protein
MSFDAERLMSLLPAHHRLADAALAAQADLLNPAEIAELAMLQALPSPGAEQAERLAQLEWMRDHGPLASLLAVFAEQFAAVEEDLEQLLDDAFIETCADWVAPYIGDLIGYRALHGVAPRVASPRAAVAHTIGYRRRKGTVAVLEQVARDVTGWNASVAEYFQRVVVSQHMRHPRPWSHAAATLRHWRTPLPGSGSGFENIPPSLDALRRREPLDLVGSAFDVIPRSMDVRHVASGRGRHNLANIGVFLWPLDAHARRGTPAVAVDDRRLRLHPLNIDRALVTRPQVETEISQLATPLNVPFPIRRRAMHERMHDYYGNAGDEGSLRLWVGVAEPLELVPAAQICACNLADHGADWAHLPPAGMFAVDPELGRIALPPGLPAGTRVRADFHHAFGGLLGGGNYPRRDSFLGAGATAPLRVPQDHPTLQAAINALSGSGVVEIQDSGRYQEALSIQAGAGERIEVRAADGCFPTVVLAGACVLTGGADSEIVLNGLLVSGHRLVVPAGGGNALASLQLRHCTLVPGWTLAPDASPLTPDEASLRVELVDLRLACTRCILGAMQVTDTARAALTDCIVDATSLDRHAYAGLAAGQAGGPLDLDACTTLGAIHVQAFGTVSNSLLVADPAAATPAIRADRRQQGCLRFSHVPANARTPRRFRCVPGDDGVVPVLRMSSLRFGTSGYARLGQAASDAIRRGADDEGEMGAYHHMHAPQREANLRLRLDEYLRIGLEAGLFHET